MKTKDRILLKALELFNEYSASAISNNRIAAEMGISPGNLHYHFRNKESVIREICHIVFEKMDSIWNEAAYEGTEKGLVDFFYRMSGVLYEYRFCFLEFSVLLKNDPILKKEYAARTVHILQRMEGLYQSYADAGIMQRISSERDKRYITENAWLVGLMWITYADMLHDEMTGEIIHESVRHIYYIIKPYLTHESDKKIQERLMENRKQ